jgi:hypothetical protein
MQDPRQDARPRAHWYHPGEVVVVARVPRERAAAPPSMHAQMHAALQGQAPGHLIDDHSLIRSFAFDAPDQPKSLVFSFHKLADNASPRAVKNAVEVVHRQLDSLSADGVEVVGAMPHWHLRAHEATVGGSPGSRPRPVYPDQVPAGWKYRYYQPVNTRFDLRQANGASDAPPVPVAVLDTRLDLGAARARGKQYQTEAGNEQLLEAVDWIRQHTKDDPRYQHEFRQIEQHHGTQAQTLVGTEPDPYRMPDHGLFVAGLIHGIAPRSPITLEPVLDETGVGDLSLLLLGLQRVLAGKPERAPQIVNLSLGFLPHPARLPAAWYGLRRPHDPAYIHAEEMFDPARDERWVSGNRVEVHRTIDLLEVGLRELSTYLSLNNCLVVAAAGNDSLGQVDAHQARMEPRLPARFNTVLGVAATTSNPRQPARYSNVGDERELGDHVATFGGNASDALEPEDGVIGIYSGEFPDQRPNETGWAFWSGTSFATAIVSGIAANLWAAGRTQQPNQHAASLLADLHAEASDFGPYVAALRTPAIEVRGRWGR